MENNFYIDDHLYPWMKTNFNRLLLRAHNNKLPNAFLIEGRRGLGKIALARQFAKKLLCADSALAGPACNTCNHCHWFNATTHPDFTQVNPAEKSHVIKVDQIRYLNGRIALKSHGEKYKIVIIAPAESMNINAANSLLKSLEEPPGDTLFLLVSHDAGLLPITVRSRCQRFIVHSPNKSDSIAWLQSQSVADPERYLAMANDSPVTALDFSTRNMLDLYKSIIKDLEFIFEQQGSVISVAEKWHGYDLEPVLSWMGQWIRESIKARLLGTKSQQNTPLFNIKMDLPLMFRAYTQTIQAGHLLKTAANKQMILESLLFTWNGQLQENNGLGTR